MSDAWCPSPRYLLRKQCVLRLLRGLTPGRALEVGCGPGELLATLGAMGFTGLGVELSQGSIEAARARLAPLGHDIHIGEAGEEYAAGPYEYVIAMEVLEHIEDDLAALRQWRKLLRDDGRLLLSVPADPARWGPSDELAGHYRRYTRDDLRERLSEAGFHMEKLWSYGVPLANLSNWMTNRIARRDAASLASLDQRRRSERSGLDRSAISAGQGLWNNSVFRALGSMQLLFTAGNLGIGYILRARAV